MEVECNVTYLMIDDEGLAPLSLPNEKLCKSQAHKERAERRAKDQCPYQIVPSAQTIATAGFGDEITADKPRLPGYLGTHGVDCKQVPEYMRLTPEAYDEVKKLRRQPEISPATARNGNYPLLPLPPVDTCVNPPPEAKGPCVQKKHEDVSFSCPRVEPRLPCCDPE